MRFTYCFKVYNRIIQSAKIYPFHPTIGDTDTLTVYSDLFGTAAGSDIFTITPGLDDGNVAHFAVMNAVPVWSSYLVFTDAGEDGFALHFTKRFR